MQKKYTLKDIVIYFFKLGTWGFGGPVALVEYMQRDLVEDKKWISQEEYKEGLALAQLAPGPLAAQLGIYLGFVHYRILGATLVGLAFVLPSFLMVLTLGVAYKLYSGLAWMQAVFYGVSAAVIGIIALSAYKLTIKSISKINLKGLQDNWLLWVFYLVGAVSTIVLQREEILLFILTGLIYMLVKAKPKKLQKTASLPVIAFYFLPIITYAKGTLPKMALFFLKAGAFVFGSGLAIVPFLHAGVVQEYKWLTENEFVDAVAVAMITPGPVVITVGFIGYLVAGFSGASVAAGATFLPCYLFTILLAPSFKKISQNQQIKLFVDGITATVIGALVGSVIVIASRSIIDLTTVMIAFASVLGLMYFKKLKEPHIILIAALIGLVIKNLF
ncbi:chromate transporter [Pedobacter puniceum]|jgi:chromate transporter|uniref:Chromate efflux transporter n=1 Tax=Pedobacter puniceum TaxID=2666136 RepID=A0A7K0FTJ1_9SPHI|nr:chromate transporter [Pedobacter puniceum]MRX48437.1 chromate efflux transporter [Pedobacter puniceum]